MKFSINDFFGKCDQIRKKHLLKKSLMENFIFLCNVDTCIQHQKFVKKWGSWCRKVSNPVDTGRKLKVHKTFRRRPRRLLNVLCTFNLCPVSTEKTPANTQNKEFCNFNLRCLQGVMATPRWWIRFAILSLN